jgi:hypothetical protein
MQNDNLDYVLGTLPSHVTEEAYQTVQEINAQVKAVQQKAFRLLGDAPATHDRTEFSAWASTTHPEQEPYLLALYDGRPLRPVVLRHAFRGMERRYR